MTWRSSEDDEKPAPLPCAISGTGEGSGGGRSDGLDSGATQRGALQCLAELLENDGAIEQR